jgi:hypothetical protein
MDQITKWTDDQIISLIKPDLQNAETIQDTLSSQRTDCYKRFRMELYGNEREGFSKSVAPVVYNTHTWTMANLIDIFSDDFFLLKGEDEERTAKFQKLIYYQMFRKQDGFRKFYDLLFTANIYHYVVAKTHYKEDFDLEEQKYAKLSQEEMMQLAQTPNVSIAKYDEVQDETGATYYENVKTVTKVIHYAGPVFEIVPPWEFYYSPDCRITDWGQIEGRLVYHKVRRTLNDVRKREKAGIYKKGTFEKIKDKGSTLTPNTEDKTEVIFNADSFPVTESQEPSNRPENILSKEVEICECYFKLDIDGDGLLEPVIIDICDDVVCRIQENEYRKPIFRMGYIKPEPFKVPGLAMPNVLENDQKIMTNLLRLIQDSAAIDCYKNPVTNDNQMFLMLQERKPFAVIKGDPQRLGEVTTSPPSPFVLKAYELLKAENEEKTGITRYNQGIDASSLNKTATGIDAIFSASAKPLRLTAKLLGNGILMGIIRDFIFINQKWPPQTDIKILGTDIAVNADDLTGEHEIEIDIGVSPAEKTALANQLDLLIQFGTQAGLQMGIMTPAHIIKAQKKKYKLLGIKVDDLMLTEEQFVQAQQQAAQQQKPDPEAQKMQMEMQLKQQDAAMKEKMAQNQMAMEQKDFMLSLTEEQKRAEQERVQKSLEHRQQLMQSSQLHRQQMIQNAQMEAAKVAQIKAQANAKPKGDNHGVQEKRG